LGSTCEAEAKEVSDYKIISDNGTAPVMLARAPGQVADQGVGSGAVIPRGARSGNPNFDPITGRFAGTKAKLDVVKQTLEAGALPMLSGVPTGVDPIAWSRRMAAVRDAARDLQEWTPQTAQTFLAARAVNVNQVDINQFLADIQWQRIYDLADVLDAKVRTKLPVRLLAPAQWTKRIFTGLDTAQAAHLVKIVEGRGWSPEQIRLNIVSKVKNVELRKQLELLYGEAPKKEGRKISAPAGTAPATPPKVR
jgi:hypothetical protein